MTGDGTNGRRADLIALALAFVVTLALELALVERKFALFGGGYGQSHVLDTPGEIALFAVGALAGHALLVGAAFMLIRRLHGRHYDPLLFRFSFLFFTVGAFAAALVAKFEVLSYFSDAVSFQLIRNLGGGSLFDAFLFALSEGALIIGGAVGALLLYLIALRFIRRRPNRRKVAPGLRLGRWLLGLAIVLPPLAFFANTVADARYGLVRMTGYGLANSALEQLTDFDRDGYSWFSAQRDRQPFDASRHPLALDIPGNGIDEDGYGGDLAPAPADPVIAAPRIAAPRIAVPKHLVVVVLESTRADLLGKRVNGRPVAPNLDALARSGSSFPAAYSHVGFTTASLKSLFSGALDPRGGDPSLFTDLKANGYRIGVFSGQPESFGDIAAVTGMQRSADVFVDAETLKDERAFGFAAKGSLRIDEAKLLREFDGRMGGAAAWARPTFVYLNFQAPHFPYNHPGLPDLLGVDPLPRDQISLPNRTRVAETYWNAVAYSDRMLGAVIARLKALGVWENTLLVVTADHGESLFDDGFLGHGHIINAQQTHIPLVLSAPGLATPQPLGLKDVRGLLLAALAGTPAPQRNYPTLLHIGPLDAPTAIGTVEPGGRFTTLMLQTGDVGLDGRTLQYGALAGAEKARVDRLVAEWGRQRWAARRTR